MSEIVLLRRGHLGLRAGALVLLATSLVHGSDGSGKVKQYAKAFAGCYETAGDPKPPDEEGFRTGLL